MRRTLGVIIALSIVAGGAHADPSAASPMIQPQPSPPGATAPAASTAQPGQPQSAPETTPVTRCWNTHPTCSAAPAFITFDVLGCTANFATGIRPDNTPTFPVLADSDGSICGQEGQKNQVLPCKVPARLPPGSLVVAINADDLWSQRMEPM